ncbi:MAG: hypothetical protein K6E69_07060 [Treponema sp.]|uniref:hypothetical protein n=1 Tax=Treponema sp. TaxID=166 RepID=UPI00298E2E71|nr:hypothetical protein [Treponema sp.]MCR5386864.1 hypothetical protein [Treponema sp.]
MLNKTNFMLIASIILCTFFTSCENPIGDVLLRTYSDPFDQAPVVDSFSVEKKIFINWDKDEGADEYILMRAEDADNPQFTEVYRGVSLAYTDENLNPSTRYLYSLDKKRGKTNFISKKRGYGYCASRRNDAYKNNTEKTAIELLADRTNMVLYFGKFCDGTIIKEDDFFYVNIPPGRQAELVLTQLNPTPDTGKFIQLTDNGLPASTFSARSYILKNTGTEWEKRPIMLSLDPNCITTHGIYMVTYNIELANITKLH